LENRTYRVLGASVDSHFEGRVIAATHVNLRERIAQERQLFSTMS
jgi:DNA-binding NtrC family response regulator